MEREFIAWRVMSLTGKRFKRFKRPKRAEKALPSTSVFGFYNFDMVTDNRQDTQRAETDRRIRETDHKLTMIPYCT
jgi:hypothetical protein